MSFVPPISVLPVFIAASLVLLVVPGPAVLFIVARSSAQGTRAGLVSVLGIHAATVVHVLAAVAGLSAIVVASATAFTAVKVAGGVYLIFLGLKTLRSAGTSGTGGAGRRGHNRLFVEGFVVNLLNPKVALFFLAFLPQFVAVDAAPVWSQTVVLGLIYIVVGLVSDAVYALLGARLGGWAQRSSMRRIRTGRRVEGALLIGLGALTLALPHDRRG